MPFPPTRIEILKTLHLKLLGYRTSLRILKFPVKFFVTHISFVLFAHFWYLIWHSHQKRYRSFDYRFPNIQEYSITLRNFPENIVKSSGLSRYICNFLENWVTVTFSRTFPSLSITLAIHRHTPLLNTFCSLFRSSHKKIFFLSPQLRQGACGWLWTQTFYMIYTSQNYFNGCALFLRSLVILPLIYFGLECMQRYRFYLKYQTRL